ncbi:uncharacterized protein HaLaN_29144 [Haematococcus lacustris]|uniref:FHA domain-containing protein n=1 Tax=Haematococcus lacustris TaxID=44745 RepID=A0A6A0ADB0_HAELA|nr:uncharacterized protein HaLaN_29144 [Haematococcus lacustris]
MNCKRLFCSLAASAFAFVLNALFFCRKRKKHNPRYSSPVPSPEQEALLGNEPLTSAVLHAAGHLRGSPPTAHSLADSLGLSVDATQLEASAVASCHEDPCSRVDKPIIDAVQPFPKPGISPVTELDVQPLLLQLSAGSGDMLGEDSSTCSPAAMEHLQDLLDVELGPPKFHVPKPTSPAVPSLATHSILDIADSLAPAVTGPEHQPYGLQQAMQLVSELAPPPVNLPDAAQLEGDSAQKLATVAGGLCKPHLRLEVLSGPATGRILDSLDIQTELRIGRFPDAALSLSEDPEVSGQHAVVRFCQQPGAAHWELVDVGSLNGTSLNGTAIGKDNRKPGVPQPLSEGDIITVGSSTRLSVSCQPSHLPPGPPSGSLPHPLMSMADHQHTPQHQQPASGAARPWWAMHSAGD